MKDGVEANGYVGGITGYYGTITGCFNKGNIKSRSGNSYNGSSDSGGISGGGANVSYSYNTGTVTGSWQVAGICANEYGAGNNIIRYCYNIGQIIGDKSVGSIMGEGANSSFQYCWWTTEHPGYGNRGSSSYSSQVSEETLKGYASRLGTTYFTDDTVGINNGFPILKWQLER